MHMYAHNLLWFPLDYVDILFKYLPCFFFFLCGLFYTALLELNSVLFGIPALSHCRHVFNLMTLLNNIFIPHLELLCKSE